MIRVAKTKSTRRRSNGGMGRVPDQIPLDAGQNQQTADGSRAPLAAGQQQQSPFLQRPPPCAVPYAEWFEHQRGYVADLIRQQQETLQHQLAEMQQQQLAFMQQQQHVINSIISSMKVQVQPCLDAALNSLGSDDAEEFASDPDGGRVSTAWHNRHVELMVEEQVHSLDKAAESSRHESGRNNEKDALEFRRSTEPVLNIMPEAARDIAELNQDQFTAHKHLPDVMVDYEDQFCSMFSTQSDLSEYGQHSPGVKTTPGTSQQQALTGLCDARGYVDDVMKYGVLKHQPAATVLSLHSLSVLWPKTNRTWGSKSFEFAGLIEVPLWMVADVNIAHLEIQFRSAVIAQPKSTDAAMDDQVRKNIVKVSCRILHPPDVAGDSPGGKYRQRIHSKLEFEPPPSPQRTTTLPGEQQKRKFCRNMRDAICAKIDRVMFWTVELSAVGLAGGYGSKRLTKASDVTLESRRYIWASVSGLTTPTRFDMSKQPTWSLGRPPDRFGGTGLSASISSTTSRTAPSQSALSFSRCASVLVPIRSSPGRFLMWFDLYHLY